MIFAILFLLVWYTGVNTVGYSLSGSQPVVTTTISDSIVASDTTIPVNSVSGFPSQGWLYIRGEAIVYADTETPCATSPYSGELACFLSAQRGRQTTQAIGHPTGTRVYNEAAGLTNDLLSVEQRTSIDEFGEVTTPWASGLAIMKFLRQVSTADWPIFDGDFVIVKYITSVFTIAVMLGIFVILGSILISGIRQVF